MGIRADVEQEIAALMGDVDEVAEQGGIGLGLGVVAVVEPFVADGHAGFEVATSGLGGGGDAAFRRVKVARVNAAEAVVDDQVRLLAERGAESGGAGVGHVGRSVEPEHVDRPELGEQLADLRDGDVGEIVIHVAGLGGIPGLVVVGGEIPDGAAGVVPVLGVGIVEADFQPVLAAGVHEFLQDVAREAGNISDVEVAGSAGPERVAIVVLGG